MSTQDDARERILRAASQLLAEANGEPVSTRAVCAAAGVGAPTLYHHFGDKEGLFDAVASRGFEEYLAEKRAQPSTGDPVDDLRRGWDLHVEFGVTHPAIYVLMYGGTRTPAAAKEAQAILLGLLERVAHAGRLRVPVETAARMVHAAGAGVTLTLIADPGAGDLSARTREAVLAAIATPAGAATAADAADAEGVADADGATGLEGGVAVRAIALRAALDAGGAAPLSAAEAGLLREWLDRLAG
ncbi:TetR/AcrR family transcriptional regulator [Actinomadura rudentiformis]|uniref:TetR/AcrR family transcriptional regulator n=1 Tax=Actinomadura rudentiformis TaxID=359158 RepID=A0A6H9YSX5_9ACTN|nr:TetR/AcrR family transcriptional regulator [Actinomadura rudentiformis]KAB2345111.1 TetR/AcrR family transcriptional regulator [Actinomadura rudentiformis]